MQYHESARLVVLLTIAPRRGLQGGFAICVDFVDSTVKSCGSRVVRRPRAQVYPGDGSGG